MHAAHVPGPVRVGGEGLRAAVHGALKRPRAAVAELVPRQVIGAAEGLGAALVLTLVRLHPRVFTQVRVQLPLLVISGRAVDERADETFVRLRVRFHFLGIDKLRI